MSTKTKRKLYISIIADFAVFLISLLLSVNTLFAVAVVLWLVAVEYTLFDLKNRAALLLFLAAFYVFLMGSEIAVSYFGYPQEFTFTKEINNHTYLCLCISLIGLIAGFHLTTVVRSRLSVSSKAIMPEDIRFGRVRKMAIIGMIISVFPYYLERIVSGLYVLEHGYLSLFVSYQSPLPGILIQLGETFPLFFFMFLATMPSKKECRIPMLVYFVYGIVSLMTGRRLYFGMAVLVIIAYAILRQKMNPKERWITRRAVAAVVLVAPITMVALYMYKYIRYDIAVEQNGYLDMLIRFFDQQGFSINVIKYEQLYQDDIGIVSLYYTFKYFRTSILTKWLTTFPVQYYNLRDFHTAYYTNCLADFIIYRVSPSMFAKGYGYGTSYIAELYRDGGYLLLAGGSAFYGVLLARLFDMRSGNVWKYTIALMILEQFMILPRYGADSILRPFYSLTNMAVLVLCILIERHNVVVKIGDRILLGNRSR